MKKQSEGSTSSFSIHEEIKAEEIVEEEKAEETNGEDEENELQREKHHRELKIWSDEDEFDSKHNSRFKSKESPRKNAFERNYRRAHSTEATILPRVIESLKEEGKTIRKLKTRRFSPIKDLQEEKNNRNNIYRSCTFAEDNSIVEEPPNTEDIPETSNPNDSLLISTALLSSRDANEENEELQGETSDCR